MAHSSVCECPGLTDQHICDLGTRIGSEWPLLGVSLGFCQAQLDQLQQAYPRNVPECIVQMLTALRDVTLRHSDLDTGAILAEALIEVGRHDLALELQEKLKFSENEAVNLDSAVHQLEERLLKVRFFHDTLGAKEKLVAQTHQCIARWKENSKFYVVTKAWQLALERFMEHNILVISGNSGDGKSTLAYYLLSTIADSGSKAVIVTTPEAIEANYNPGDKVVFLVDDAFGTPTVNNQLVDAWIRLHDKLRSFNEDGDFGLLITTRTQVLKSCWVKLESYQLYTKHSVDLDDKDNKLSEQEKRQILEKYCSDKDVALSTAVFDQIKSSSLSGFPLLCKLYAADKHLQQIKDFFCTPLSVLNKQLLLLSKVEPVAYCGLVLILTHDGELSKSLFDVFSLTGQSRTHISMIKEACSVDSSVSLTKIRDALETLVGVYVAECEECFTFIHDAVFDATTFVFGEMFPREIIRICSPKFLLDRIRSENARTSMYSTSTIKSGRENATESDVLFIQKHHTKDIACRFISDIKRRYLYEVFNNPSIFDVQVQNHMIKEFTNMTESEKNSFMHKKDGASNERVMHFICNQGILAMAVVLVEHGLPLCSEFLLAACNQSIGHEDIVNILVNKGVDINEQPEAYGAASIHAASVKGNAALVEHLIKLGADISAKSDGGTEALHLACRSDSFECAQILLANGADPKAEDSLNHQPIHMAASLETVDCLQLLVESGADIFARDAFGFQAIHLAANSVSSSVIEYLLGLGADPNSQNKEARTPLHFACRFGRTQIIQSLISKGASVTIQDIQGRQPIHDACASSAFNTKHLNGLLDSNINSKDKNGMTPLHHACRNLHVKDNGIEKVALLLLLGADIHEKDGFNMQALTYACESNSYSVVELLLEKGADVYAKSKGSRQAIHFACANGDTKLVAILIDHGADPGARSGDAAKKPIHFACRHGDLQVVKQLLDLGVDINDRDEAECTPLFYACFEGSADVARLLLDYGADPELTDYKGRRAIDMLRLRSCDPKLRDLMQKHSL